MTTIFPKVSYPDRLKEWLYDTDFDDIFRLKQGTQLQIDYKNIGALLMCVQCMENFEHHPVLIEFLQEADNYGFERRDALNSVIRNIKYIYHQLQGGFSLASEYNFTQDIILYRGFRYTKLAKMYTGDVISTKMFMTTSMIKETALRFTDTIMWRIVIPKHKFPIFKYTNLSHRDYNIEDYDLFDSEALILLNIGTILRKIASTPNYKVKYRYPKIDNTIGVTEKTCELVTYTFVGHGDVDINGIICNHKFSN
jgi:hypothetical protein